MKVNKLTLFTDFTEVLRKYELTNSFVSIFVNNSYFGEITKC